MITAFDDFPIHAGSRPVNEPATSDPNHYDRYFFNGYTPDRSVYFAAAMGLYPNRDVADASFSVMIDGQHTSVFNSQRAPADRAAANHVGAVTVEIVEPLQTIRLIVDHPQLRAELTFTARSGCIEEPPFLMRQGIRVIFDYTRLTQFGRWSGWIEVDGVRHELDAVDGSRDRSWGIRPLGAAEQIGAPAQRSNRQFFWLWAPISFPGLCTHMDVNEYGDGRRWHEGCFIAVDGEEPLPMRAVDYTIRWEPGTRHAAAFSYDIHDWDGGVHHVELTPDGPPFIMQAIGYGHPRFNHGSWVDEAVSEIQRFGAEHGHSAIHIQAPVTARYTAPDGTTLDGRGILEQLAVGPHPSGLVGLVDPFQPGIGDTAPEE